MNAIAALFKDGGAGPKAARDEGYRDAMAIAYARFPDDETKLFYGLAILGTIGEGTKGFERQAQAAKLFEEVYARSPDHPGVLHYLIHAYDDPVHAEQGLEAARRYAKAAAAVPHALHMPSHIFIRLGLWQDSITSNIAANTAGARAAEIHLAESHYQTHAMDFLSYSYLQSGQEAKAREVIEHTDHVVGASEESKSDDRAYLAARTALELHRWKEAAALPIPPLRKSWQDTTFWARAIGAARTGNVAAAESAIKELTQLVADREKRARKRGYPVSNEKASDLREAEAWLAFAKGKSDEALQELRAAADRQDKDGGESVGIPAREMLADMLSELKRPAEALAEYQTDIKNSPNRFDALLGAARAAQAAGDAAVAQSFYAQLASICSPGADRPELAEVKTFLARK